MFKNIMPRNYNGLRNEVDDFYNLVDQFFNNPIPKFNEKDSLFKVDIQDLENAYIVDAELPGFNKDEINIDFEDGRLTISASKNEEMDKSDKEKNYIHKERRSSSMTRTMSFENIDEEKLKAKLDNGVLKITIPKNKKEIKSKKIEIE